MDMMTSSVIFIIAAFALAAVTIMKRDTLPPKMRKGLALISLVMIVFAFFLIVYSLFTMGEGTA